MAGRRLDDDDDDDDDDEVKLCKIATNTNGFKS